MPTNELPEKKDVELVRLTLADQANFRYLVERYQGPLLAYIRRLSGVPPEEAEDILQETFLSVYRNLRGFDQDLKFSSWIYRITHNKVISHYRFRQARPQTITGEEGEKIMAKIASAEKTAAQAEQRLAREEIFNALPRLPKKYRQVIILRYLEEKDYREISDIMQKPEGTVGSLLNRAKKKLRREIEKKR
jgi:RNA polymerase sigma-70 factor (ECF subfamily)